LGSNDPKSITQRQLGQFRLFLDKIPKNHGKSSRDDDLPVKELIARGARLPAEEVGLSAEKINRHLTQLATLLKYFRSNGFETGDPSLLRELRPTDDEDDEDKRNAFETHECEILFAQPAWGSSLNRVANWV